MCFRHPKSLDGLRELTHGLPSRRSFLQQLKELLSNMSYAFRMIVGTAGCSRSAFKALERRPMSLCSRPEGHSAYALRFADLLDLGGEM